jgi:hypothetical protein
MHKQAIGHDLHTGCIRLGRRCEVKVDGRIDEMPC